MDKYGNGTVMIPLCRALCDTSNESGTVVCSSDLTAEWLDGNTSLLLGIKVHYLRSVNLASLLHYPRGMHGYRLTPKEESILSRIYSLNKYNQSGTILHLKLQPQAGDEIQTATSLGRVAAILDAVTSESPTYPFDMERQYAYEQYLNKRFRYQTHAYQMQTRRHILDETHPSKQLQQVRVYLDKGEALIRHAYGIALAAEEKNVLKAAHEKQTHFVRLQSVIPAKTIAIVKWSEIPRAGYSNERWAMPLWTHVKLTVAQRGGNAADPNKGGSIVPSAPPTTEPSRKPDARPTMEPVTSPIMKTTTERTKRPATEPSMMSSTELGTEPNWGPNIGASMERHAPPGTEPGVQATMERCVEADTDPSREPDTKLTTEPCMGPNNKLNS